MNPFRTAVPFWGQTSQTPSNMPPERDCTPKRVDRPTGRPQSIPYIAVSVQYLRTTTLLILLRGIIVNRTYGTHKNLHIYVFSLTIFGPIYYGPP